MNSQENIKEIIVSKENIDYYLNCYAKYGFIKKEIRKVNHNLYLVLENNEPLTDKQKNEVRFLENKLRVYEISTRKKTRYNTLEINLLINIVLLFIQSVIFKLLNIKSAHPNEMITVAGICLIVVLLIGIVIKLVEKFKWNKLKEEIKEEIKNIEYRNADIANKKIISVLFTRSRAFISKVIYWFSGREYTHASIGFDENNYEFYSFDYRGFRTEHPSHRKIGKYGHESLCLQFLVSDEEYDQLKGSILNIKGMVKKNRQKYKYNYFGAVFGVLHIFYLFKKENEYFCSEFVSMQLKNMKSFDLKKSSKFYMPSNLAKALCLQDNLYNVLVNKI